MGSPAPFSARLAVFVPVLSGRHPRFLPKYSAKMALRREVQIGCDFLQRIGGIPEHPFCLLHLLLQDILSQGESLMTDEKP